MAKKLSNKQHFMSLMKKVKNYRGTKSDTWRKYREYLLIWKHKRPIISDLFPTHTVRNISHFLERFWDLDSAKSEILRLQGGRYLDLAVKERAMERMKTTNAQKSLEELEKINVKKAHNFKDPAKLAEYYGISQEEAKLKYEDRVRRKVQSNKDTIIKLGGYKKRWSCKNIEFWTFRGFSADDAKIRISILQNTRSLESIMTRHNVSESEALNIQSIIANKCSTTFNARPQSEKDEILWKRTSCFKRYSKASSLFFKEIIAGLGVPQDFQIYVDDDEYFIYDHKNKSIYFYDFTIPQLNLIIEYNGIMFHPRVKDTPFITVTDSLKKDLNKEELANHNNFEILYFWEKIDNRQDKILQFRTIIKNKINNHDSTRNIRGT